MEIKGRVARRSPRFSPAGTCSSSTMIVIRIARTASLNASKRPLCIRWTLVRQAILSDVRGGAGFERFTFYFLLLTFYFGRAPRAHLSPLSSDFNFQDVI